MVTVSLSDYIVIVLRDDSPIRVMMAMMQIRDNVTKADPPQFFHFQPMGGLVRDNRPITIREIDILTILASPCSTT